MIDVIDETDDHLVVNKPPHLLIHPKKPGGPATLWDHLREFLAFELINGGGISIINRLDRETSGIVLIAKHPEAARKYHSAMERRGFRKEYLALVHSWPEWEEQTLSAPLLRQGEKLPTAIWLKRCVHPEGAEAITRFRVEERLTHPNGTPLAWVRAFPETGRTHQIRVHIAHLGHPIVGDKIYGADERCYLEFIDTGWTPSLAERLLLNRHALHSERLTLEIDGEHFDWRAPLPPDLLLEKKSAVPLDTPLHPSTL